MIKIKGHSNFDVRIISSGNEYSGESKYYIQKSTTDGKSSNSSKRLYNQMLKQVSQRHQVKSNPLLSDKFDVPYVHNFKPFKCNDYYIMDYIKNNLTMIEFIEKFNLTYIDLIFNRLIELVKYYISQSIIKDVKHQIISKYESVIKPIEEKFNSHNFNDDHGSINNDQFIKIVKKYIKYITDKFQQINIPIGICHGDLTFSNILVVCDKFYLIDLLDNFIETPLQDIVKIRQDTKYLWTMNLINFNIDKTKLIISLNKLDNMIDTYFKKNTNSSNWYKQYYNMFQILNFLRIIPYVELDSNTSEKRLKDLKNIVTDLIKKDIDNIGDTKNI